MIVTHKDIGDIREKHAEQDIGLRLGCYDILHAGHQEGIKFAKERSDVLVVGVMPDKYVTIHKTLKPAPTQPAAQAANMEIIFQ